MLTGSAINLLLPGSPCGNTPTLYTALISLRQRPRFYTAHFLLRQRPAFDTDHFSLRQRPPHLY